MNTIQTHFWAVRDYLAPVLRESKFKEHGRITPEEFVAAGDFLTYKFPTWTWSSASSSDAKYTRDFLPNEKQYLISRGVPCLRRVSQMEKAALGTNSKSNTSGKGNNEADERLLNFGEGHDGDEVIGKGGEDDWLATHLDEGATPSAFAGDIADIPDSEPPMASMTPGEEDELASRVAGTNLGGNYKTGEEDTSNTVPEIGDIPDMDDEEDDELGGLGEGVVEAHDPSNAAVNRGTSGLQTHAQNTGQSGSKLVSVRTYDCLITYDKYYQTPRMWLIGYNESGQPLKPAEIFEDVSSDYAQKTVTVEPFPHGNLSTASIHPCKHASVMKKVIERMNASVIEEQRKANNAIGGTGESGTKKKKGWGLGGAMKKISGSGKETGATEGSTVSAGSASIDQSTGAAGGPEEEGQTTEIEGLRVDQYLLIFLKFMASIVPAIEIDATQAV